MTMIRTQNNILNEIQTCTNVRFVAVVFRYLFFFYSFLSFIFWFLNCFEVDWLYYFNPLFAFPYSIVKHFYVPHGVGVDFTVAIIGGIALLFGFFMDLLANSMQQKIYDLQEEEQRMMNMRRNKMKHPKNYSSMSAVDEYIENNIETAKLVFLLSSNINRLRNKSGEVELTFQNVELWKQRINKKLIENISYSKPVQKGFYRKNLFIVYKDFNYVDDFIHYINPTMDSLIVEFKKYGVDFNFFCALSVIPDYSSLEKELDFMDTIITLKLEGDSIILSGKFKTVYDTKVNPKYILKYKGEYNLSKNLTISNRQPLYVLKERIKKEDMR